jgi:hypothetical protein
MAGKYLTPLYRLLITVKETDPTNSLERGRTGDYHALTTAVFAGHCYAGALEEEIDTQNPMRLRVGCERIADHPLCQRG